MYSNLKPRSRALNSQPNSKANHKFAKRPFVPDLPQVLQDSIVPWHDVQGRHCVRTAETSFRMHCTVSRCLEDNKEEHAFA